MNAKLKKVKAYLDEQVQNHSVYVWGGSGTQGGSITESWIRGKEARSNSGAQANNAVAFWRKQVAAGYGDVLRAFDCSGLISRALMSAGLLDKRSDCDRLYGRCTRIDAPRDGCLLFRVNSSNSEDETHVGMYFGGKVYHAKGRTSGVVCEAYSASYWHKAAWLKALGETETTAQDGFARILKSGMKGEDVAALKALLIAAGYSKGITAGNRNYGRQTAAVVRSFQAARGLDTDGQAGPLTIAALGGKWSGA